MQKTILAIDDDEALLDFYRIMLKSFGTILTASDLAEARQITEKVDLIILDFNLDNDPELFQDVVAELKGIAPILLCSGVQDVLVPAFGATLGIVGYWNKSSDRSRLLELVSTALR